MIRSLAAAFLLAALAGPALAGGGFPPGREDCDTLAESKALAQEIANRHGAEVRFIDGAPAGRFLAALNPPGSKAVMAADHVAVLTLDGSEHAQVMVMDNPCGGAGTVFKTVLSDFALALAAARR